MLSYEAFKEELTAQLQRRFGEEAEVYLTTVKKNNHQEKEAYQRSSRIWKRTDGGGNTNVLG